MVDHRKHPSEIAIPDFGDRFKNFKCLTSGSFGQVYVAHDSEHDKPCVVKVEPREGSYSHLRHEAKLLTHLNDLGMQGIPRPFHFEKTDSERYLFMDCLGPSLADLTNFCGGTLS